MADYKILPNSLEAEQAILGCILLDNESQSEIFDKLGAKDFYSEAHKKIFSSMQTIFMKGIPVDFVTLTSQLEVDKRLQEIGGIDYVTYLTNVVPSAANFNHYLDIVKDNSVRRHIILGSQAIAQNAFESQNGDEAMQFAEKTIFDLSQQGEADDLELVGKPGGALTNVLKMMQELAENKGKIRGIPTGYKEYDEITGGLQKGTLIILAARPGVGKTSLAMNIAVNAAMNDNRRVAIFSLEMGREELMQRALASVAKVNLKNILEGNLSQDEWKRVWTAEKKLAESKLYVNKTSEISPLEVRSKCQKLKMNDGLDLIVIDYLQLMNANKNTDKNEKYEGEVQKIQAMTRTLKLTARELGVPIIVLSQLSRTSERREAKNDGHKPILADLRGSGSIEQDADIVLFLYNPAKYADVVTEDEPGTVYLIVAKHRSGGTGEIKLRWVGEMTTYLNMSDKVKVQQED